MKDTVESYDFVLVFGLDFEQKLYNTYYSENLFVARFY